MDTREPIIQLGTTPDLVLKNPGKVLGPIEKRPEPSESCNSSCHPTRRKGTPNWNELAFSQAWNSGLAYTLGVIAGDGTIHPKRIVIELSPVDRDILEVVCDCLGANPDRIRPVHRSKQKQPTLKLDLSSPVASHQLIHRLGLSSFGPKHSKLQIPPGLPDRCLAAFARGLVDTDGSVNQSGPNSPVIQMYSHSMGLLEEMRARVSIMLGIPRLGAMHRNTGLDAVGRPRKGGAWVITGYEAQAFAKWLWPPHRKWIGGGRKAAIARELVLAWIPLRAQKRKREVGGDSRAIAEIEREHGQKKANAKRPRRAPRPGTRTYLD